MTAHFYKKWIIRQIEKWRKLHIGLIYSFLIQAYGAEKTNYNF